jgi:uncharacterized membrane protein YfcA
MTSRRKRVLRDAAILVAGTCLIAAVFSGAIGPYFPGRILGIAGLLAGVYYLRLAFRQKEHSNLFRRLKGDEQKIPTTTGHRILNASLAMGMITCGAILLWTGLHH